MGTTRSTRCLAQTAPWLGAAVTNMAALPDDRHVEGAILGLGSARENRFLGSERPTQGPLTIKKIDFGFRARPAQGGPSRLENRFGVLRGGRRKAPYD